MLTTQRKQLILTRLARDGQVVAKALSEELQTSEDTIRR
ncbi:MAG TPA: DeoR family transcriptional regulator, partial [Burkholderiaceae bacterium]|nr:DeoR family transcriptional regulator [Burkholderiaceae bacterium]